MFVWSREEKRREKRENAINNNKLNEYYLNRKV